MLTPDASFPLPALGIPSNSGSSIGPAYYGAGNKTDGFIIVKIVFAANGITVAISEF